MSYSNETPNFKLPQYTRNDKPTYQADFNKAMLEIDTALKNNQTSADSANSSAETANATAQSALTSATNAENKATSADTKATDAKSTAETAQTTATQANNTANNAQDTANNAISIARLFNITQTHAIPDSNITIQTNDGTIIQPSINTLRLAHNDDASIGKIYGLLRVPNTTGKNLVEVSIKTTLQPKEVIGIAEMINVLSHGATINEYISKWGNLRIDTNGTLTFSANNDMQGSTIDFHLIPVLIFFKNFGDSIEPASM